jgi:hypothetical protein
VFTAELSATVGTRERHQDIFSADLAVHAKVTGRVVSCLGHSKWFICFS